jgi:hypothetical protein
MQRTKGARGIKVFKFNYIQLNIRVCPKIYFLKEINKWKQKIYSVVRPKRVWQTLKKILCNHLDKTSKTNSRNIFQPLEVNRRNIYGLNKLNQLNDKKWVKIFLHGKCSHAPKIYDMRMHFRFFYLGNLILILKF